MPDVRTLLRDATTRLAAAGVPSPEADAEQLLAHAAGVGRGRLRAVAEVGDETADAFVQLVTRRVAREPLQHLTGRAGFRHLDLEVGPGVFVPRPETEVVAEAAIQLARLAGDEPVVVDLCSGSGAIALSVAHEVPHAAVHAVEADPTAYAWLVRNADARRDAGDRPVTTHLAAAAAAVAALDGTVDVVVSNPPYLAPGELDRTEPEVRDHDPRVALVAAEGGLAVVRDVVAAARRLLHSGGWLVVEHGDEQGETVPDVLTAAGFTHVSDEPDLAGRPRVALGRLP